MGAIQCHPQNPGFTAGVFNCSAPIYKAAVRSKTLPDNPFADQVAAVKANTKRFHFISGEQAEAILDTCPDTERRLLFALARYGGLRVPSEALGLKWTDIDWPMGNLS